jgi:outer membrane protein, multidrug efflux system
MPMSPIFMLRFLPTTRTTATALPTATLVLFGLVSCASNPDSEQDWNDQETPESAAQAIDWQMQPWWQEFSDEQLDQVVSHVLENNLDLQAAGARLRQLELQTRMVAGQKMPSVAASLGSARSRTNLIGLPFPGAPEVLPITTTQANLGLNLSWELDLWGRLDAEEDAAIAQWQAGSADWQGAQLSLAGQAGRTWMGAVGTAVELQLAEEMASIANDLAEHLGKRYQQGLLPADVWHSAQNNAQQAEARLHGMNVNLDQQQRALRIMMSGDLNAADDVVLAKALPQLPPPLAEDLSAQVVSRRPDLRAAEARLLAATAEQKVAEASLYPRLSLTASGGTSSNTLGDLLDGDLRVWSLAGNLVAPLFEGGRLRNQVKLREAGVSQFELEFVQRALMAYAEVEGALVAEQELRMQYQAMEEILQRAQNDQQRAQRRFQQGVDTLANWLQARLDVQQKQLDLLQVHRALLLNRIDLYLALGGDLRPAASAS